MNTSRPLFFIVILLLLLSACGGEEPMSTDDTVAPIEEVGTILKEEELVTHNVTYTGVLEKGGVTIYQQGTHRLMLSDGRMVLLKREDSVDSMLNLYVGKLVRVKGDVMPTVEAGGTIMTVKDIVWIRREKNADGNDIEAERVLCGEGVSCQDGFICALEEDGPGMCVEKTSVDGIETTDQTPDEVQQDEELVDDEAATSSQGTEEALEKEDDEAAKAQEEESDAEKSKEDDVISNADQHESVALMVDEDYADDRWTQEYCSQHISFCIPVHKNWYFKSFGTTASLLWHVEMGALNVDNFGDGPISVDLKTGDLVALGLKDGDVKTVGSRVIGYRIWSDSRHFEISADASLKTPVAFVTKRLKASE